MPARVRVNTGAYVRGHIRVPSSDWAGDIHDYWHVNMVDEWDKAIFCPLRPEHVPGRTFVFDPGEHNYQTLNLMEMLRDQLFSGMSVTSLNPVRHSGGLGSRPSDLPPIARWFAQEISSIRAVKTVLVEQTNHGHRLLTIMDSEPGNRLLKDRIYEIEGQALDEFPNAHVDFRVINLAEFADPEALHLPVTADVVYRRE